MKLVGANRNLVLTSADRLPGQSNYIIGNDLSKWRTGVPQFARVRYQNVYPGVDLVFYGNQGQLEYDLVINLKTARTLGATSDGSTKGANSTSQTPSSNCSDRSAATWRQRRDFPLPPLPVSVSKRALLRRVFTSADSFSRPMNDVNCSGRLFGAASRDLGSWNACRRAG